MIVNCSENPPHKDPVEAGTSAGWATRHTQRYGHPDVHTVRSSLQSQDEPVALNRHNRSLADALVTDDHDALVHCHDQLAPLHQQLNEIRSRLDSRAARQR